MTIQQHSKIPNTKHPDSFPA